MNYFTLKTTPWPHNIIFLSGILVDGVIHWSSHVPHIPSYWHAIIDFLLSSEFQHLTLIYHHLWNSFKIYIFVLCHLCWKLLILPLNKNTDYNYLFIILLNLPSLQSQQPQASATLSWDFSLFYSQYRYVENILLNVCISVCVTWPEERLVLPFLCDCNFVRCSIGQYVAYICGIQCLKE